MLKNPYPIPTEEDDKQACRFATYIDAGDRALLMSLRAVRGTAQAAVNNLILNLCNDLRDLNLTSYRPDADDILSILVERRPLTDDQLNRLRRTTLGTATTVPPWLQQHRRRTEIRKGTTESETGSSNPQSSVEGGVRRNRTKTAGQTKSQTSKETNVGGGHSK